jgi:hypothetical protein
MMMTRSMFMVLAAGQLVGCAAAIESEDDLSSTETPSWEEFRASTYQENFAGGHFIVNGDIAIRDEKQLYEFWESLQRGALIVNRAGNGDDKWNDVAKLNLTYCVSNNFGSNKQRVIDAMAYATDQRWEQMANVNFIYVPSQDSNCTANNNNVVFDIRPVSGQPYLARAFFPSSSRHSRNVLIDTSSFGNVGWPLENIIGHELGHTLGFRHEHTRPEAGTCFEDNNWRPLTPYDSASIMHYPQCNGSSNDLDWTSTDAQGAAALYGAPGGGGGNPPPPPPPGDEETDTRSGSVAYREMVQVANYPVQVGTTFTVIMSGSGDPDLYVRWNAKPSTSRFHCRPYLDGPDEQCSMTVPSGATRAYVAVRGYRAGTYTLNVTYTAP